MRPPTTLQPKLRAASDENDGTRPTQGNGNAGPWRTIGRAVAAAGAGDAIAVGSGHDPEQISLVTSRIQLRALPGPRPLIDGENIRSEGILVEDAAEVLIEGFEIANHTRAGVVVAGGDSRGITIRDNLVHHAVAKGISVRGTGHVIEGNLMHQCWTGLSYNSSSGVKAFNNFIYDNCQGFIPKHVKGHAGWNLFWHNTLYGSHGPHISIAVNRNGEGPAPDLDYLDIRNSLMVRAGHTELEVLVAARFLKFTMVDKFADDGRTWSLNRLEFDELTAGRFDPPLSQIAGRRLGRSPD